MVCVCELCLCMRSRRIETANLLHLSGHQLRSRSMLPAWLTPTLYLVVHVFQRGAGQQVDRVNAGGIVAGMPYLVVLRDRAIEQEMCHAMCSAQLTAELHQCITIGGK